MFAGPLRGEEVAAVIGANTLTGRQAALLRRTWLASEAAAGGPEPAPEQKGGEE